ncbi:hypothetical protein [Nonomuraea maritima]|uniref:hypothetical protein n=1 Tax=Nonomuraea maritima TaxID=683260 RepID=UPI003716CE4D
MAKTGYSVVSPAVSLSANTARSVLGVLAPSSFGLEVKKIRVSTLGTAVAVPGDIQLCAATFASNLPGTASTSVTPQQLYGRSIPAAFTAAHTWTSEPTELVVLDAWSLSPNSGTVLYDLPLGDSPDCGPGTGFVLRARFADAVSVAATLWVERC